MELKLKQILAQIINDEFDVIFPASEIEFEYPKKTQYGDLSTNIAMRLSSKLKKAPIDIAKKIIEDFGNLDFIEKVEVAGNGFINFTIKTDWYLDRLQDIVNDPKYPVLNLGKGKKVIVEYSSPNIAKPFTIGHFRSTIIGDSIANILEFVGFAVYRDNHLGDWGTQFGKLIYAIKTWGNEKELDESKKPIKKLVELYVKFHKEAESDPKLEDYARAWFKKLEQKDEEAIKIWEKCINWSLKEFTRIYDLLGVKFTENNGYGYGESFFIDKVNVVIKALQQKNLLKKSRGAFIVEFNEETKLPPLMIIKKDGTTLYSTRDLATDRFRLEKYGKDIIIINEVGGEQKLYFQQIFETERLLGWFEKDQRYHKMHGLYRLKEGKMSTRKGRVIWLEDVLNEAIKRARQIMLDSKKEYSELELEEISRVVGIGALKWNDLKRQSHLDIVFDWDEILNLDGNSAPYMQYTYARANSILKEVSNIPRDLKVSANKLSDIEIAIIKMLVRFPDVVTSSAIEYAPNYIANYLFNLAQEFNKFYKMHHVLKESDQDLREFRIALTYGVSIVIKTGLNLLGISVLDKM